jgi:hypothetical protein
MPRSRRHAQVAKERDKEAEDRALRSVMLQLVPGCDDKAEMQRQLAAEFLLDALRGEGVAVSPGSCDAVSAGSVEQLPELEELLAEALETVEVGSTAPQRAEASQTLLQSGVLRAPTTGQQRLPTAGLRLRLEAEVAEEEAAAAAELFALRAGTLGAYFAMCVFVTFEYL